MPPKRVCPQSSASPPPAEKRRNVAVAISLLGPQAPAGHGKASAKVDLGCVSVCSSDDDQTRVVISPPDSKGRVVTETTKSESGKNVNGQEPAQSAAVPSTSGCLKPNVEVLYVYDSDEEAAQQEAVRALVLTKEKVKAAAEGVEGAALVDEDFIGLHEFFHVHVSKINKLVCAPLGDSFVKLSEIPEDAGWYGGQCLGTMDGRALVLVVYGTLHFVNLQFARIMLPSFSVVVELFRECDRVALQRIFDIAEPRHMKATGRLQAFRAGHDEDARLMNIYDCTDGTGPEEEGRPCGVNELLSGDIVRVVMRCEKVVDDDNGRVSVDFKLRKLELVLALPRRNDIKN